MTTPKLPEILDVTVDEEDMRKGLRGYPTSCPIARAVKRQVPGVYVSVGRSHIQFFNQETEGGFLGQYELPDQARDFIRDFDAGMNVEPISFRIPRS